MIFFQFTNPSLPHAIPPQNHPWYSKFSLLLCSCLLYSLIALTISFPIRWALFLNALLASSFLLCSAGWTLEKFITRFLKHLKIILLCLNNCLTHLSLYLKVYATFSLLLLLSSLHIKKKYLPFSLKNLVWNY